jgi:hypothetical protein
MVVQAGHAYPISKITKEKRVGGAVQVVENLPSKCKAPQFKSQCCLLKKEID